MSCARTREVLDQRKVSIAEERQAKKAPLTDEDAQALLQRVKEVIIAQGKSSKRLVQGEVKLADLRGPTGNFRAPMLIMGKTLLVGFSEPALKDLLK